MLKYDSLSLESGSLKFTLLFTHKHTPHTHKVQLLSVEAAKG